MKKKILNLLITVLLILISSTNLFAQAEVSVGADLVSRYIWRGLDFGSSPSIQPTVALTTGSFEVGVWGAYQLGRDGATMPTDEIDLYLGYTFNIGNSSLGLVVTDYYYPQGKFKIGDIDGDGNGAHTIEVGAIYSGPESFPIYLSGYVNVHNDPDYSAYFEVGYSTAVQNVSLDFFIGATPGGVNAYYNTDSFSVTNIGIKAAKEIKINNDFSLPIFGSLILNPNQDIAYLVFGISI
ncbi:MAG: hypothetical protein L3J41_06810 [Melioribacteraceae bacterium]|nr:hypothetical protein [Melioribacteraceae bacterium]